MFEPIISVTTMINYESYTYVWNGEDASKEWVESFSLFGGGGVFVICDVVALQLTYIWIQLCYGSMPCLLSYLALYPSQKEHI